MSLEQHLECPERALVAAVIAQAVRDVTAKNTRESALRWIDSPSERVFGFVWCCQTLGVDPQWARAKIHDRKSPLLKAG
jgi:hypothetical protein